MFSNSRFLGFNCDSCLSLYPFLALLFISGIFPGSILSAQEANSRASTGKPSHPEKCWALSHPFVAKRAYQITREVLSVVNHLKNNGLLDGDLHGGQVDAFKHAYWMAALVQEIHWRKARRLGWAHEKGNYIAFRKAWRKGDASPHDLAAIAMDMWNNQKGIETGLKNHGKTLSALEALIILSIEQGEMRVIKKDNAGNFLDKDNRIIDHSQIKGIWDNPKMLVPSDYKMTD